MNKHQRVTIIAVALACLISGFISGVDVGRMRGIPFAKWESKWSIGIYVGASPYSFVPPMKISNPVLTAKDVTDISAVFVADHFMVRENDIW